MGRQPHIHHVMEALVVVGGTVYLKIQLCLQAILKLTLPLEMTLMK